jgi:hypothetical protein
MCQWQGKGVMYQHMSGFNHLWEFSLMITIGRLKLDGSLAAIIKTYIHLNVSPVVQLSHALALI